jgi:hypothetical protein
MKTKIKKWWNNKPPEVRHVIIWQWIMTFTLTGMLLLALVI